MVDNVFLHLQLLAEENEDEPQPGPSKKSQRKAVVGLKQVWPIHMHLLTDQSYESSSLHCSAQNSLIQYSSSSISHFLMRISKFYRGSILVDFGNMFNIFPAV